MSSDPGRNPWQSAAAALGRWLLFHKTPVIHRQALPGRGPVLFLGLHRNGAADGFLYRAVAPRALALVSKQLTRGWLGRRLFRGIEVVRDKDAERYRMSQEGNRRALERCVDHLAGGGHLFILPEGSSDLGPRHLPFRRGAARVLVATHAAGVAVTVVPLGLHYERADAFRSNVETVVGEPFGSEALDPVPAEDRLELIHRRITDALEAVGVNVADPAAQARLERSAYVAALDGRCGYFQALKRLEPGLPAAVVEAWERLDDEVRRRGACRHLGVPVAPIRPLPGLLPGWLVAAPVAALAAVVNAPPLIAGWAAGRRLADAPNVVTFWRSIVGIPTALAYWLAVAGVTVALGRPGWLAAFAALTVVGLASWRYAAQRTAIVCNGLLRPALTPRFRRLDAAIREAVSDG